MPPIDLQLPKEWGMPCDLSGYSGKEDAEEGEEDGEEDGDQLPSPTQITFDNCFTDIYVYVVFMTIIYHILVM